MNQIQVFLGKKQLVSDIRVNMAFETAFHEPPVSLHRTGNQVTVSTQLPLKRKRVVLFSSCLGLKAKIIGEELAEIR